MPIEKLEEFARDGQKNTDELILTDGFPRPKFPARQWFNYLFNMLSLKINELIELDPVARSEIVDNLTANDATKPLSAKQGKDLQDNKLEKDDLKDASTDQKGIVQLNNTLTSTSNTQALTAAQGKILNDQDFGINQDYTDVTSERIVGTTYVNPTNKLRVCMLTIEGKSSALDGINLTIGDKEISSLKNFYDSSSSLIVFFVPPQKSYKVSLVTTTTVNIISWWEF